MESEEHPTPRADETLFEGSTAHVPKAGTSSDADGSESLPGRVLGPYRVSRRLGTGGMGDVFLAFDETLSRKIALKRIRPDRAGLADVRRRFDIEARVTAMLQHPSIVPVYHYDAAGAESFYTMRPIEGTTLGELLRRLRDDEPGARQEWSAGRLVRLFLQAANAVAFAHSRGVIHRDLKPENIMIGPYEEVLVLDWGMAKVLGEGERGEVTGPVLPTVLVGLSANTGGATAVGTPSYMAPEQFAGQPAGVKTDVFSLGVILYELLALRIPWVATTLTDLRRALTRPPESPNRVRPGRGIPPELSRVALRALEFAPESRFESVAEFARAVARALEGRAPWRIEASGSDRRHWRIAQGKLEEHGETLILRSRGMGGFFRYFCSERFTDDMQVEFEINVRKKPHEFAVWLNTTAPREELSTVGYRLEVLAAKRRTLTLLRSGRLVAGGKAPPYEARRWYTIRVAREDDRFSLSVDGKEIYVYHDPIPRVGGYFGLTGQSDGLHVRNLKVYSRGASRTVSCLSVPDAFFNRRLFEDARAEYDRIAASHPGRREGQLAGFRGGMCFLELAEEERDVEMRGLLYQEARDAFSKLASANDSCLRPLGGAMVAAREGDAVKKRVELLNALRSYPDDPHRATVVEWMLAELHALPPENRRALADLLPLAITYCMEGWGRGGVSDRVRTVRRSWEIPSFITSRSHFREADPVSHAEAKLFFGFWGARPELIESTLEELVRAGTLGSHHVTDAVFALLELGRADRGRDALLGVEVSLQALAPAASDRARLVCEVGIRAELGDLDEAERLFNLCTPDPTERAYNETRLLLARALAREDRMGGALRVLRSLGSSDGFAREHQAWFLLAAGDAPRAARQLRPFVERGDHRSGKNLTNFLHGSELLLRGREGEAWHTFSLLNEALWPRTWTLGSHYALDRLGGGKVASYLAEAFPWERRQLERQASLLATVRGKPLEGPLGGADSNS